METIYSTAVVCKMDDPTVCMPLDPGKLLTRLPVAIDQSFPTAPRAIECSKDVAQTDKVF